MGTTKLWTVEIFLNEEDLSTTHAVARLDTSEDAHIQGRGTWRGRGNTDDPKIGDDIAVARALSQIVAKLSVAATGAPNGSRRAAGAPVPAPTPIGADPR